MLEYALTQSAHLMALIIGLLASFVIWTAMRMPRLPNRMHRPIRESGLPERSQQSASHSFGVQRTSEAGSSAAFRASRSSLSSDNSTAKTRLELGAPETLLPQAEGTAVTDVRSSSPVTELTLPLPSENATSMAGLARLMPAAAARSPASQLEPPAPVEFSIFAPTSAPPDHPFDVRINIAIYDPDLIEEIQLSGVKTVDSLLLDLRQSDELRLDLQDGEIELDTPSQTIVWNRRDITIVFVGRLPVRAKQEEQFTTTLVVSMLGLTLGLINFSVLCRSSVEYRASGARQFWSKKAIRQRAITAELEGKGFGALRFKRAFVSHVTEDVNEVSYIVDFLRYCGVVPVFSPTDFFAGVADWRTLAREHLMHTCDTMVLCWSESAAKKFALDDSPIRFEMDIAAKLEADRSRKRFAFLAYQLGSQLVPLPLAFRERPMNSAGLITRMAKKSS
jgi:hypothetical protein